MPEPLKVRNVRIDNCVYGQAIEKLPKSGMQFNGRMNILTAKT